MKQRKSRFLSMLTAAALGLSTLLIAPAAAAESNGVTTWNASIGGNTAHMVTVEMRAGRTGEISLANNSIAESASAKTLIDNKNVQADTHVVAAINGGFFNSYTKGSWVYPNNCPLIYNPVVNNGKVLIAGSTSTIGFTAEGKPMVDWVKLGSKVKMGNGYDVDCDAYVNTLSDNPWSVMLFNDHLTLPVNIPASSTMVYIENKQVTKITPGGTLTVPKGVDVLVFNSEIAADRQHWGTFPTVGISAEIMLTASGTERDSAWAGVETAVAGGPLLVKNGANVVNDQRNSSFYNDPKQKPDVVLARSFVGVTWSGGLVMGTVTASFNQIADWMVQNGIMEGVSMDGGASSMLYADGVGFTTPAGRNLASALVIVDRAGKGGLAEESNVRSVNADVPSGWAAEDIQAAISLGLVPEGLQGSYRENISRQDFCLLIESLARKDPDFIAKLYANPIKDSFTDVTSETDKGQKVLWVAQMGVIDGYTDGSFRPYQSLTRAQAAKILALTTQFLGGPANREQYPFTDRGDFPNWAAEFIDYCGVNKIMNGKTGGVFDPGGKFTREQAIITMLNLYNAYLAH